MLSILLVGNCEKECRELEALIDSGKQVTVSFTQDSKRSLDENAYYWVLTGRIAKAIGSSITEVHNMNLRRYGAPQLFDGKVAYAYLEDTPEVEKSVLQNETVHMKPTSSVKEGKNGKTFRAYMILKGSHDMDVSEMSALIDGAISECRELGLPNKKPWEV
jgi:hypothetical protein